MEEKTRYTAIVKATPAIPPTWQLISSVGEAAYLARRYGFASAYEAALVIGRGYELGFGLFTGLDFIHNVQGRPTLSPQGHLALLHNSGLFNEPGCLEVEDIQKDGQPWACRVKMRRADSSFEYEIMHTLEDAKRAGVFKPDSGWQKYPANMLRWRAIGFCADVVAPDIGGGMKRSSELSVEVDEDGNIIEGEWITTAPITAEELKYTLGALLEKFTPDQILDANGGKLPATDEEVGAVAKKLENA